ncbi:MAG: type IV pilus twitching motility protein PilT [Planctomycetota bacterium]
MTIQIDKLLDLACDKGASDLHLTVGAPPVLRLTGKLRPLKTPPLSPEDTNRLMQSITSDRAQQELAERGGADFGFSYGSKGRFRVSVFKQQGSVGLCLRLIPQTLYTLEQLGLPDVIQGVCLKTRGLMLVTGPTGSGKTTTLAAMVNYINQEVDRHVLTIEDPIEYVHRHKKSIINQREVGVDVPDFAEALRRGLRQDPDVILLGEMRDLETVSTAITAAETGHMVFGTLHTIGAGETIHRVVDAYPENQQDQVRAQLSTALVAVLSQTLLPRADGKGRIAAYELLIVTPAIAHLIRENKIHRIDSEIQTGARHGMRLLDDHLLELFTEGKIRYQDMLERAKQPDDLAKQVKAKGAQRIAERRRE